MTIGSVVGFKNWPIALRWSAMLQRLLIGWHMHIACRAPPLSPTPFIFTPCIASTFALESSQTAFPANSSDRLVCQSHPSNDFWSHLERFSPQGEDLRFGRIVGFVRLKETGYVGSDGLMNPVEGRICGVWKLYRKRRSCEFELDDLRTGDACCCLDPKFDASRAKIFEETDKWGGKAERNAIFDWLFFKKIGNVDKTFTYL